MFISAGNTSGSGTSQINHIINGTGGTVGPSFGTAYANYLWLNPTFCRQRGHETGTNISIVIPQRVLAFVSIAI